MKNIIWLFVVLVFSFSGNISAEGRVAIVNLDRAIGMSNYSREQYQKLQSDENYKKLIAELKRLQEEISTLQKEGETKSLTWSEEKKQEHVKTGQAKVSQLNNLASQEKSIRDQLDASIQQALAPKIEVIVNNIIEEKKIGLLLKAQAVFFREAEFDITEDVVKRLNSAE